MKNYFMQFLVGLIISGLVFIPVETNAGMTGFKINNQEVRVIPKAQLQDKGFDTGSAYIDFNSEESPVDQIAKNVGDNADVLACFEELIAQQQMGDYMLKAPKGLLVSSQKALKTVTQTCDDITVQFVPAYQNIEGISLDTLASNDSNIFRHMSDFFGIKEAQASALLTIGVAVALGAVIGWVARGKVDKKKDKKNESSDDTTEADDDDDDATDTPTTESADCPGESC
ncbi:MAG: hypothetical protein ACD_62C00395G0009 [uncultured bacterium]|nr:MAG: hypothetical protein ACD_62C00395G0009 [uncultured bacterium]HLD44045.1 hypothetical protein [bacterium]